MDRDNIVLVGFMGTGKTTVGKLLASRLGMKFVDMDEILEQRAGKTVSRIFAEDGEDHFRKMERNLVKELSKRRGLVIAAGGGIVLNGENIRDYAGSGLVVCLSASPETILKRVSTESHRPLLEQGPKADRIKDLLASRRKLYAAIPCQVATDALTPEQVVVKVLSFDNARHA